MPDNRDSGLDPSFIDAAWDDMQRQLDESMPVESKSKRRIIAWWWWAAGLLLPVASLVWFNVQGDQPQLDALPIDFQGKTIRKEMLTKQAVAVVDGEKLSTPANDKRKHLPGAQANVTANTLVNKTKSIKGDQIINNPTNQVFAAPEVPAIKPPAAGNLTEPTIKEPKTIGSNSLTDETRDRKLLPLLLPITPLSPKSLATEEFDLEREVIPNTRISNWALEIGTSTRSFTGLDGLFVGLNQEWGRANHKWSFGAGIHYRFQRLPIDKQDLSSINISRSRSANTMDNAFGTGQDPAMEAVLDPANKVVNFANGDTTISVPISQLDLIQKLHYVDFPLYANFKARPNFQLFIGVQFSVLAKAYLDIARSRSTNEADLAAYQNVSNATSIGWYENGTDTRIGANTSDFQRLQLGMSAGFTYYPTAKIGLRLQYRTTPISVYKAAAISTYDHWIGTSVLWRFGGK